MGADRGQSRRHRARRVSTEGKPRSKNQLSAAAPAVSRRPVRRPVGCPSERSMPAHPSVETARAEAVARLNSAPRNAARNAPGNGPSSPPLRGPRRRRAYLEVMQRIIGTEVEYGISSPSDPTANPILTSTQAVLAYAAAAGIQRAKRTRWDYEVESPLRDARGFDLSRSAGPPPVVDADEVGAADMILTNGARLDVEHAHPEYSAPECTDPLDAVIWDKAGERVMEAAARHVASVPGAAKLQL